VGRCSLRFVRAVDADCSAISAIYAQYALNSTATLELEPPEAVEIV
jgi:L-amino acid N-acyltransferase YncA